MTSNPSLQLSRLVLAVVVSALLSLPSCTEDAAGIEVAVTYRGESIDGAVLVSADGQPVRLSSAYVAVESLELEACPDSALARVMRLLGPAVARAHSAASPTRIGVPVVVDALREVVLRPGRFRPVPGVYCGLSGTLSMPDADALVADPSAPLDAAVTLLGERLGPDDEVLGTFELRSTRSAAFELTFDEPLVLDASMPSAEAELVIDASAWLSATTLPEGELDTEGARALTQAAATALRVEWVHSAR